MTAPRTPSRSTSAFVAGPGKSAERKAARKPTREPRVAARKSAKSAPRGSYKVKRTVSLDPDVVDSVAGPDGDHNLSALVNTLLRDELDRRSRRAALDQVLADLEAEVGPVDEERVSYYAALLQ